MPASRSQIGSMYAGLDGLELCSCPPSSRTGRPSTISCVPVAVERSAGSGRSPLTAVPRTAPRSRVTASSTTSTPSASRQRHEVHQAVRQLVAQLGCDGVRPDLGLPLDDRRDRADPPVRASRRLRGVWSGAHPWRAVSSAKALRRSSRPAVTPGPPGRRRRRTRTSGRATAPSLQTTPTIRPVMPPATSVERYRPSTRPSSVNAPSVDDPGDDDVRSPAEEGVARLVRQQADLQLAVGGRSASPSTCRTAPTAHTARTRPSATSSSTACVGSIRTRQPAGALDVEPRAHPGVQVLLPSPDEHRLAVAGHPQAAVLGRHELRREARRAHPRRRQRPPSSASVTAGRRRRGLDVPGEHRPAVLPDDLVGEGLPAEHVPLRARAAGADAVVDDRPAAVGPLHQVGVPGVLHRLVGAAVRDQRVAAGCSRTAPAGTATGRSSPRGRARCRPRR